MKSVMLTMVSIILLLSGCVASKTKYIETTIPTNLYMRGEVVAEVEPGTTLKVVDSKTCRGGRGTCWWVKNEELGIGGIVSADEMEKLHRVYEVEEGKESK